MPLRIHLFYVGDTPEELHNHIIRIFLGCYYIVLDNPKINKWEDALDIELKLHDAYSDNNEAAAAFTSKIDSSYEDKDVLIWKIKKLMLFHFNEFYGKEIGRKICTVIDSYVTENKIDDALHHIENNYINWHRIFAAFIRAQSDLYDIKSERLQQLTDVHVSSTKNVKDYKRLFNGKLVSKKADITELLQELENL